MVGGSYIERPIRLPGSPFWNVFKRFGRDELIALIVNVMGTIFAGVFFSSKLILSIFGPIIEKIGFFPANLWDSWKIYKTSPNTKFSKHFKNGIKASGASLAEDILVHDPVYIILMYLGLTFYKMPLWFLSASSFVIAIFAVSGLEVAVTEIRYLLLKKELKKAGFGYEQYYETRFLISRKQDPKKILNRMIKHFNLREKKKLFYYDSYFENNFSGFSGRIPKLRLRKRTYQKGWLKSVQIVFTRASESNKNSEEQFRFFTIKKEKFYSILEQKMPNEIGEIKNTKIRNKLKNCKERIKDVVFERNVANSEELLVSVDQLKKGRISSC